MKVLSLALVASLALAGYAQAQTASPTPAPAPAPAKAAAPAPAASSSSSSSSNCKKEVKNLCGRARGQEMQDCVKSGIDMNKFSADCKAELSKPKS